MSRENSLVSIFYRSELLDSTMREVLKMIEMIPIGDINNRNLMVEIFSFLYRFIGGSILIIIFRHLLVKFIGVLSLEHSHWLFFLNFCNLI